MSIRAPLLIEGAGLLGRKSGGPAIGAITRLAGLHLPGPPAHSRTRSASITRPSGGLAKVRQRRSRHRGPGPGDQRFEQGCLGHQQAGPLGPHRLIDTEQSRPLTRKAPALSGRGWAGSPARAGEAI